MRIEKPHWRIVSDDLWTPAFVPCSACTVAIRRSGTAREAFRELLSGPIEFTPSVERGYRAIRFDGKIGLEAVFGGEVVTNVASPTGSSLLDRRVRGRLALAA